MSEGAAMQLAHAELVRVTGYGDERLSIVLVTGTVLCIETVKFTDINLAVSEGAKVAVACKTEGRRKLSWAYGLTDDDGEFIVDLPSHLHANPKLEEDCIVRVLRVPKKGSFCDLVAGVRSNHITLSSVGESIRVYTAGTLILGHRTRS
ncbi:hypothetical protein BHM03_00019176 [Ensete ventricosum]|nr:hypothetical protein BHM03_00019176 [Ensete ventricosum]